MEIQNSYIYKGMKRINGKREYIWYQNEKDWISSYISIENEENDITNIKYKEYIDPDKKGTCTPFYEALTEFLNIRECKVEGLKEKYEYEFSEEPYGIKVMNQRQEIKFYLKSDQFGFSAPTNPMDKNHKEHPYDKYLELAIDRKKAIEEVAEWLYRTRGLGGSFLWPMESIGEDSWVENPNYNIQRGKFYIEDRVDFTLLEIKRVLDEKFDMQLDNCKLILKCEEGSKMREWLEHFGSFKNYVDFFCFNSFVDEAKNYIPFDIVNSEIDKEKISINQENINYKDKGNSIYSLSAEELKKMFKNISVMINNRTEKMKDIFEEMG